MGWFGFDFLEVIRMKWLLTLDLRFFCIILACREIGHLVYYGEIIHTVWIYILWIFMDKSRLRRISGRSDS